MAIGVFKNISLILMIYIEIMKVLLRRHENNKINREISEACCMQHKGKQLGEFTSNIQTTNMREISNLKSLGKYFYYFL
jgi:hypothetical protein